MTLSLPDARAQSHIARGDRYKKAEKPSSTTWYMYTYLVHYSMKVLCIALLAALTASQVSANELAIDDQLDYNYEDQAAWANLPGSYCGTGRRQSPINIETANARESSTLFQNLMFNGYDEMVNGSFDNNGDNVQFTPGSSAPGASVVNHEGTYDLLQFHLHWGEGPRNGSEHRVNSSQYAAEIHFVHNSTTASSTAGNALTVVGVFAVADSAAPTGIWQQLMPVPTAFATSSNVTGIRYSDLLPTNRDYYYYEGSLTTPLCNEIVQWFVLKETIRIPESYLRMLRMVQDANGTLLTHNVRDEQPLNGRIVMTPSSASNVTPSSASNVSIMSMLALCILAIVATLSS